MGDMFNTGVSVLLVVCAEGVGFVFDLSGEPLVSQATPTPTPSSPSLPSRPEMAAEASTSGGGSGSGPVVITPVAQFPLLTNVRCLWVADVDCDGRQEVVVGAADRSATVFRLERLLGPADGEWELRQVVQWNVNGEVGSVSHVDSHGGMPAVLVGQPGGRFLALPLSAWSSASEVYAPNQPSSAQRSRLETLIVGLSHADNSYVGVCTTDGAIRLHDLSAGELRWEIQVSHRLLSLTALDMTGSGADDLVVCAWDGMTYIMDPAFNVVRFDCSERVCAFAAGKFSLSAKGPPSLVLVYVTYSDKIKVYCDVALDSLELPGTNRTPSDRLAVLEAAFSSLLVP
ncbi:integrin-alpha FG-GAP repeat-containing protein 2 [Thecamonas trahens ATCC 50062]|uniref:Integrin-alpha FG-GAP repeat-containing protein 2 n=1 Tax=Thecamonas trahens ATCC 50062 TaxID=461836 RepID=A0A0L0DRZ0_THETB|nr:integrin-alpha FG-GAP repeat-containing protein 2 [Thecamonas trahens ATCC 50062]KNC54806.1 integrin-alpha FG-GAP repeat-containing protein 2 [Thecamonas trahens ATCC 50062]|eukprot:XP_013761706.1 integrin-alpha FG-GAP repeat-containing protein 2 [Thecamonas trahens ATCC 50062]